METLTVIIPCLNEEQGVVRAVEGVVAIAPELPVAVEVLMIDDGSTDDTAEVMERLCQEHSSCRMRRNPRNMGLGRSVMSAYEQVPEGSWVTVMPGDHEIDFESIKNFLDIRDQYDLILGYLQNPVIRPMRRRVASAAFGHVVRSLYGLECRYLNGLKMYRSEVFRGLEVKSSGYAYTAELVAKAILRNPSLRIGEAPFVARGRAHGSSNAFRPKAIANAAYEVVRGQRAVASYRNQVIRATDADLD